MALLAVDIPQMSVNLAGLIPNSCSRRRICMQSRFVLSDGFPLCALSAAGRALRGADAAVRLPKLEPKVHSRLAVHTRASLLRKEGAGARLPRGPR